MIVFKKLKGGVLKKFGQKKILASKKFYLPEKNE